MSAPVSAAAFVVVLFRLLFHRSPVAMMAATAAPIVRGFARLAAKQCGQIGKFEHADSSFRLFNNNYYHLQRRAVKRRRFAFAHSSCVTPPLKMYRFPIFHDLRPLPTKSPRWRCRMISGIGGLCVGPAAACRCL
jgi:hypothetical protein